MKSPVHSTLDIWCSSKLICQHLGYTRDLIFWRDDQRDHACSIPENKIQHEQKIQQSIEYQSMLVICSGSTDQQKDIKMLSNSKQGCSLQSHLPKGRDSSIYATNLGKYITFFKDMFGKFCCHLQFWFIQSTKLNWKCITQSFSSPSSWNGCQSVPALIRNECTPRSPFQTLLLPCISHYLTLALFLLSRKKGSRIF